MNFAAADVADNRLLNEAIWKSVRGAESVMPEPRHRWAALLIRP